MPQQLRKIENADLLSVSNWMMPYPHVIEVGKTYREAAVLLESLQLSKLPIIDERGYPVGVLTAKQLLSIYLQGNEGDLIQSFMHDTRFTLVPQEANLLDLFPLSDQPILVVDAQGKLVGMLIERDFLDAFSKYIYKLQHTENTMEVLSVILEKAYEGIAVVDENGILLEFNEAYSRFTGVKRNEAIGRHVTEVIENTNLHITVKTGIPDRGVLQTIQGQPMVVHRIPLRKEGEIIGAIGMLIFEGISEMYEMYDRLQGEHLKKYQETKNISTQVAEDSRVTIDQIIGTSEQILNVKRLARKAARTTATVFISGESGTGKEVFAKSIHHLSPAFHGPFISVNCGAIPENLFESELFGYEAGAFTGAHKDGKPGKFELAHNGTLFLDEIGELSLILQTKLLRVLQEREIERVGGVKKYHVNVRVIAATNRDIEQMVKDGSFRKDLYYRLNIIRLHLPALRERKEDIPLLLAYFVKEVCKRYAIAEKRFSAEAVALLANEQWHGNIRELVNTVEQVAIMSDHDVIGVNDLPTFLQSGIKEPEVKQTPLLDRIKSAGEDAEKQLILQTMEESGGNKSKAAKMLGIHRTTLYQKLKKFEIQ